MTSLRSDPQSTIEQIRKISPDVNGSTLYLLGLLEPFMKELSPEAAESVTRIRQHAFTPIYEIKKS